MDNVWLAALATAVIMAVGLWMIRSMVLHRGRERHVARAAAASAMSYSEQDGPGLSKVTWQHFASGDGQGWSATNLVSSVGTDGLKTHAFDARSWTEYDVELDEHGNRTMRRRRAGSPSSSAWGAVTRRHQGSTRTAAMTQLPINAPHLLIARENVLSKLFAATTRLDIDVESEMFNRSYHVISANRGFAAAILDARMVDLMVRTEGKISFEFSGSWALLHASLIEPELFPGLVRLGEELRDVIPRLVLERWPRPGPTTR